MPDRGGQRLWQEQPGARPAFRAAGGCPPPEFKYPERLLHREVTAQQADLRVEVRLHSSFDGPIEIRRRIRYQREAGGEYRKQSENTDVLLVQSGSDLHERDAEEWLAKRFPREVLGYFIFDAEHSPVSSLSGQLGEQLPSVRQQVEAVLGVGVLREAAGRCAKIARDWGRELAEADAERGLREARRGVSEISRNIEALREERATIEPELQRARQARDEASARLKRLRRVVDPGNAARRESLQRRLGEFALRTAQARRDLAEILRTDLPLALVKAALRQAQQHAVPAGASDEFFSGARFALRAVADHAAAGDLSWAEAPMPSADALFEQLQDVTGIATDDAATAREALDIGTWMVRATRVRSAGATASALRRDLAEQERIGAHLRDLGVAGDREHLLGEERAREEWERLGREARAIEDRMQDLEARIGDGEADLELHKQRVSDLRPRAARGKQLRRQKDLIEKAQRALELLAGAVVGDRLKTVESEASRLLQHITHKPDTFDHIEFDPDTLRFRLLDPAGRMVPPDPSTGEVTVLALAIVHGLQAAACMWLPLVVEAPLRPLDPGHVTNVIRYYFARRDGQTVLLEVPGKSQFLLHLLASLCGRCDAGFILFDYKGDLSGDESFVRETGAQVIRPGQQPVPVNPFDLPPGIEPQLVPAAFAEVFTAASGGKLGEVQRHRLIRAMSRVYADCDGAPTLSEVQQEVHRVYDEDGVGPDTVLSLLDRLVTLNLFADRTARAPRQTLRERWILDLSRLRGVQEFVAFVLLEYLHNLVRSLPDAAFDTTAHTRRLRAVVAVDEAHYYLRRGCRPLLDLVRIGRSKGVPIFLSSQSIDDFSHHTELEEFLPNTFLFRHGKPPAKPPLQGVLGLSGAQAGKAADVVTKLEQFHALTRTGNTEALQPVRIRPFFETHNPSTAQE